MRGTRFALLALTFALCSTVPATTPVPARPRIQRNSCLPVPYVPITLYGTGVCYRLAGDLVVEDPVGPAIRLARGDVELDLAGHELRCETGCGSTRDQIGISAYKKSNLTIRGGVIRGFTMGIHVYEDYRRTAADDPRSSSTILLEDLELVDNAFRGIRVVARDATIRNNRVVGTGPGFPGASLVMGIESYGPRARVSGNLVAETRAPADGEGVGIAISDWGYDSLVHDNTVTIGTAGAGADYGLWFGGKSTVSVARNRVTNYRNGLAFSSTTAGKYFENVVLGAENAYFVNSTEVEGNP